MIVETLLTIWAGCLFAEFFGYWLHKLLHSNKIEYLSRNHMIHHLVIYAPNKPMRLSDGYFKSVYGRTSLAGIGMEWLGPVVLLLAVLLPVLNALHVPLRLQGLFIGAAMAWGYLVFSYMHDAMHLKDFWMEKSRFYSRWFFHARKLHDIHHMALDDLGRMNTNYGICFFFFDRLFDTLASEHKAFNHNGLKAAAVRYAYIWNRPEVRASLEHARVLP